MTFYKCVSIKYIDISSVDTQGFFDRTFSHCENLESIIFSKDSTCDGGASTFNNCKKLNYIKCSQAMKDAMIENQNAMGLPNSMREGGSGTWEIIN